MSLIYTMFSFITTNRIFFGAIFFAIINSCLFAQSNGINKIDSIGRKQGFWKKFDENGQLKYEGYFKDNIPQGEFKYFYPSGKTKATSKYSDKGKRSFTVTYHPDGLTKMTSGRYFNEKKDSLWKYYDDHGRLISEESYSNGVKQGVSKNYFEGGEKVYELVTFKNGLKHGDWIRFYPDGTTQIKATYEYDLLQGLAQYHYLSGKVMISGTYKSSVKDGVWMYFDEIGKTQKKEIYKEGHLVKSDIFDKSIIEPEDLKTSRPKEMR